ncbi:hypothetical protein [Amantichitinum ursilacus]|uniref:Uncharacterized protein n=1 Tax=Amantichitinum ursilacus TaxID=857265 RepID=A0A0N0GNP0_9NEIS|nr:hypothetical protein [Amantichitinum ursilacus]KPC52713.1 hypothetical protein WG78_12735 [Amantichitinum ursilacus]
MALFTADMWPEAAHDGSSQTGGSPVTPALAPLYGLHPALDGSSEVSTCLSDAHAEQRTQFGPDQSV